MHVALQRVFLWGESTEDDTPSTNTTEHVLDKDWSVDYTQSCSLAEPWHAVRSLGAWCPKGIQVHQGRLHRQGFFVRPQGLRPSGHAGAFYLCTDFCAHSIYAAFYSTLLHTFLYAYFCCTFYARFINAHFGPFRHM